MRHDIKWLTPQWPAPAGVRAAVTLRSGGISLPPFNSLNLADHVGDDAEAVMENRARLVDVLQLPAMPCWLQQVHGADAVYLADAQARATADAGWTDRPGVVCAVLTADCLPLLLCDQQGSRVAAVHAGWRGLAAGVIEATITALGVPAEQLIAWSGPAIGPAAFEVGEEVREAFIAVDAAAASAFTPTKAGKWHADLYTLARQRLAASGVSEVHGGGWCTVNDAERFYSYRRDGETGRMATLIWLE